MATILLSAAGAAIGGGFGGTILGLSGAVIGRAVGATLGRAIDQRLMGAGSQTVEMGRVDRLRLSSARICAATGATPRLARPASKASGLCRMKTISCMVVALCPLDLRLARGCVKQRGRKLAPRPPLAPGGMRISI